MVDDEDMNDAVDDGSRGRERRRSFWRLSGARHDQDVFQPWGSFTWRTKLRVAERRKPCAGAAVQKENDLLWNQI
jgi:hypothetical protein